LRSFWWGLFFWPSLRKIKIMKRNNEKKRTLCRDGMLTTELARKSAAVCFLERSKVKRAAEESAGSCRGPILLLYLQ
jgi:hypothetical protein